MHAQQTKKHSPGPARTAAEPTCKAASSAWSPMRIPAWVSAWSDQFPASLLLPGERPVPRIQTKLTINQLGASFEQEADHVADQVMRRPDSSSARHICVCGGVTGPTEESVACATKRKAVQRKVTHQAPATTVPSLITDVLNSSGERPLDAAARFFMEPRFGQDFSHVRVHTDERAVKSVQAVNAKGYTAGKNIVFSAEWHVPGTTEGRRLLAHELAHAVQQNDENNRVPDVQRANLPEKPTLNLGLTPLQLTEPDIRSARLNKHTISGEEPSNAT